MFLGIALVIAVFCMIRSFVGPASSSQSTKMPIVPKTEAIKQMLFKEFPNQNKNFKLQILSSYDESIQSRGNPSIVMLVYDDDSAISDCILNRIFKVFGVKNVPELDGRHLKTFDIEKAKLEIDNRLENAFKSGQRYFLVKNIQEIPNSAMLIFYKYGDILPDVKYPGVMIFFTYKLKNSLSSEEPQSIKGDLTKLTVHVEKELTELWSDIHFDQLMPLFARVTNNVAFVEKDEKSCKRDEF